MGLPHMPQNFCIILDLDEIPRFSSTEVNGIEIIKFPFDADHVLVVESGDMTPYSRGQGVRRNLNFNFNTKNKELHIMAKHPTTKKIKITFYSLQNERNFKLEELLR